MGRSKAGSNEHAGITSRELRVTITSLARGGDGVGLADIDGERRAVFVPHVAPGDDVRVLVDAASRPARGRVLELVTGSPDRITPACRHVERCGGCDWMHLSVRAQVASHEAIIRGALPVAWRGQPVVTHDPLAPLAYRTRARLHVRASGGRAIVGMHRAGTRDPVEVDVCVVLDPSVERARLLLPSLFEGAHGRGDVEIARGAGDGDGALPVLDVRWDGSLPGPCFARLERGITEARWAGARVFEAGVKRPAVVGDPTPWMRGADGEPLRLAPGGFAQASAATNDLLGARIAARLHEIRPPRGQPTLRIVELYAGAGNLTVVLARPIVLERAPTLPVVTSVEASREACEAARANLAARKLAARVVEADAETYELPASADVVVLDPPRTGARAVALRLASAPTRDVLYVSCDPATLGRDLAILEPAYELRGIETFEMFPQTSHVETLVHLTAPRASSSSRRGS